MKTKRAKGRHLHFRRRLKLIVYFLENRFGGSLEELMVEIGVPRRTLYRDIVALKECGFDVRNVTRRGGDDPSKYRLMGKPNWTAVFKGVGTFAE